MPLRSPSEQLFIQQLQLSRHVLPALSRVAEDDAVEPFTEPNAGQVDDAPDEEPACDIAPTTDEETEDTVASGSAREADIGAAHGNVDARVEEETSAEFVIADQMKEATNNGQHLLAMMLKVSFDYFLCERI